VGDGRSIKVWEDPWVPRGVTRKPVTPRGRNLIYTVDKLIDLATEEWDIELLSQTFREDDVQVIRTIPIHTEMNDVVGWHFDSKGCFSVKSANKVHRATVVRKQKRQQGAGSGESSAETRFWKDLWNLDCQPKVKHFLWRLSHNTLVLRKVLQRRRMKLDTRCCMCGSESPSLILDN
jgi:hypothetical protein